MQLDQAVLSIQFGDIDGDYNCEKVVLFGTPYSPNQPYIQQVELLIHYMDDLKLKFQLDLIGYDLQLFLGDFLKMNQNQILITGRTGGENDAVIVRLYTLEDNRLKLLLDEEDLAKKLTCQAGYINMNGMIGVTCPATGQTFMIDSRGPMTPYAGVRKDLIQPMITTLYTLYPVKQPYEKYYSLQIQQRIIGAHPSDVLGMIQTVIELTQEAPIIKSQRLINFSKM